MSLEEDHEIIVSGELFYYTVCPFCTCEFTVWQYLKPDPFGHGLVNKGEMPNIFCPCCGKQFPLVTDKAPLVLLSEWSEEPEE